VSVSRRTATRMNEPLMRAMIAVASRCAECDSPPAPRGVRVIAAECAREQQFDRGNSVALIDAAEAYAEGVCASLSDEL
jgi:hypothetical protein